MPCSGCASLPFRFSSAAIADTLRIVTSGDYDQALATLNLSQRQIPVVVKLRDAARQDFDLLSRLTVPGSHGPVLLGNVARIELGSGPPRSTATIVSAT